MKKLFKSQATKRKEAEEEFEQLYKKLYTIQKTVLAPTSVLSETLVQSIAKKIIGVIEGFELQEAEYYNFKNVIFANKSLKSFLNTILDSNYKLVINFDKIA